MEQEIKEKIIQKSISLEGYGLNDLAWTKEDAINLINSIMQDRIGILGGDVYRLTHDGLESLCDNWVCEPNEEESDDAHYLRSKVESINYIENYPEQIEENIIFSITFTERFS